MAKLPQTGVAYRCLYEYDCTLLEIMESLGLKPLGKKAERELRDRLGFALAQWEEPCYAVEVKDVVSSLSSHAKRLDEIAPLRAPARMGMSRSEDIAVSAHLVQSLSEDPTIGNVMAAQTYLCEFCDRARTIASASRAAAARLGSTVGKDGHPRYRWHDELTAVLVDICRKNGIMPKARIDRVSGEPVGRFVEVAAAFERLLLPEMRSPTPQALVKRLQRSLNRVRQRSQVADS
jgi:hypothetical protein